MKKVVVFQAAVLGASIGDAIKTHQFDYTREIAKLIGYPTLYRYSSCGYLRERLNDDVADWNWVEVYLSDTDQGYMVHEKDFVASNFTYTLFTDRSNPELVKITERYIETYPAFKFARIIEIPDDVKSYHLIRDDKHPDRGYEIVREDHRVFGIYDPPSSV